MADFTIALSYTLKNEGGMGRRPEIAQGPTMRGITLNTAKRHGTPSGEALNGIPFWGQRYWHFDAILMTSA
jgi:lysozyme family protein